MRTSLKQIYGPWDKGWVLDKHMVKSTYLGADAQGRSQFDSQRTDVGEATYQLKYQQQWDQAPLLAQTIAETIYPKLRDVGLIVPMPASVVRVRQPVSEVAHALGQIVKIPVFAGLLVKTAIGKSLKDLVTKEEKAAAIGNSITVNDTIAGSDAWNVLLIDDLFDSGASMEAATKALRGCRKIRKIYVAALTWK